MCSWILGNISRAASKTCCSVRVVTDLGMSEDGLVTAKADTGFVRWKWQGSRPWRNKVWLGRQSMQLTALVWVYQRDAINFSVLTSTGLDTLANEQQSGPSPFPGAATHKIMKNCFPENIPFPVSNECSSWTSWDASPHPSSSYS